MNRFSVCFVCTGNICRSPMAETVFRQIAERSGHGDHIEVTSAGTGDWHVGEGADPRTVEALRRRGYDGSRHRAKQFEADDFGRYDLVVVFDRGHERILRAWAGDDADRSKVQLLLSFDQEAAAAAGGTDVPDPYYSDAAMFDSVLDLVERASSSLFTQIEPALRQGRA
ncbi:low molecular weight protein-tyrosine-phosphatase [Frigoribacterium sp. 2-23]|uniref:low molecular weight protein-tyrosine-phosphatase n=1 Tax=Frigoribacterium sp. 2-23 TaxID=3415006 RepID=UPI003C6FBF5D